MAKFVVNGREVNSEQPGDTPLLWVIREELGLTGTKFGCGIAQCGACTVHVNGNPVRSCSTPVSAVAAKKVTTIEGLSPSGEHPLQKAWVAKQVPQCGYCQSGQIMPVSYTHLRAHETPEHLVCRLLLEKKKNIYTKNIIT